MDCISTEVQDLLGGICFETKNKKSVLLSVGGTILGLATLGGGAFLLNGAASPATHVNVHIDKNLLSALSIPSSRSKQNKGAIESALGITEADLTKETLHLTFPTKDLTKDFQPTGFMAGPKGKIPIQFSSTNTLFNILTSNGTLWYGPIYGTAAMPSGQSAPVIIFTSFIPGTSYNQYSMTISGNFSVPVHIDFG